MDVAGACTFVAAYSDYAMEEGCVIGIVAHGSGGFVLQREMENSFGIIQSRELEISSSPIQPENTPMNSMSNSENDLSQPISDSVPPITGDVDAYEMTKDGKRKLAHFEACKRRPYKDIRQSILVREHKKVDGSSSYLSNYHFNPAKSRNDLASMIIIHEYPLSIVDHLGFREYSEGLQLLFKVPNRNTIKSDIIKIYENEKLKTMRLLDKIESKIALTLDMWTASNQKKRYMTITTHYIDDDWDMQSCILRFVYIEYPHTAEIISNKLFECVMAWNIDRKLSTITLDNCNTNDCVVGMLLNKLDIYTLMLEASIGMIGPNQYLHVKDKRLYSFQDSDYEEEDMENASSGVTN
ncbi:hypothetical protein KIW84_034886 [Lathyrus oleraceus]|uniref:AC transposase n=1 Tax=Pisum sativum TaxID=3888 RepID=A0A9D4Y0K3_PEA|nr:hypothetical protein KIW84_034886 [Pisum sativum]